MAYRTRLSRIAFWGVWVVAGMVGYMLPTLGAYSGWFGSISSVADAWIANVVYSAIVAFPQYIVLRRLIGHSSLVGAMWIPVSVVAWLAAYLALSVSAERITNALLSVGAIQALTPDPVSFITVIEGVEGITFAAALGLAQGLLLARVFVASSATWRWFLANLAAAVVIFFVIQCQNGASNRTNQTVVDFLLPTAILGGLYAAVTGIALVVISRSDCRSSRKIGRISRYLLIP